LFPTFVTDTIKTDVTGLYQAFKQNLLSLGFSWCKHQTVLCRCLQLALVYTLQVRLV